MTRLVCSVFAALGLSVSPAIARDCGHAFAPAAVIAVPLVIEDAYGAHVFAAPLVQPLFFVPQPVLVTPYRRVVPLRSIRRCR